MNQKFEKLTQTGTEKFVLLPMCCGVVHLLECASDSELETAQRDFQFGLKVGALLCLAIGVPFFWACLSLH